MEFQLDYARTGLKVNIPDKCLIKVFQMKKIPVLADPIKCLKEKLDVPIGSDSLKRIASKAKTACIVVSDKTRPVPNQVILPVILDTLLNTGIKKENITILIANGLHSPMNKKEILELLGEKIMKNYRVVNHQAEDKKNQVFLGKTPSGTPVYINNIYYNSDLKILTGFIEPHFMTGFSGGRKSICPGIVGIETIKIHHGPNYLESPFSAPGILKDNPCHQEAVEVARMCGVDFIVNVTLDAQKRITGIFAGDLEKAHLAGADFCEKQTSDYIEEAVDIVVTSGGGYPLDCNFYQTVKGLIGALDVIKKDGTIIIASGCSEGIGSADFKKLLFEMKSPEQFLEMISQEGYFTPDQWEVEELIKVLKKTKVKLYTTGLTRSEIMKCHVQPVSSVEQGIKDALNEYGENAKIAVIPNGPYILAKLKRRKKYV